MSRPVEAYHLAMFEISYCLHHRWRGMWFGTSYAVLAYILFILASVLYTLLTGKDLSFGVELGGHVFCAAVFVTVVGSFVGMVSYRRVFMFTYCILCKRVFYATENIEESFQADSEFQPCAHTVPWF